MLEQRLEDVLELSNGQKLVPHQRDCGSHWIHPKNTESFKLVDRKGSTLAIYDAWCVEDACFGYVEYDASGQNFVSRDVFRLTPPQDMPVGAMALNGQGQIQAGP